MFEILKVIAMLCSIESGQSNSILISVEQKKCHAYYAKCIKPRSSSGALLLKCMKERK